MNGTEKLQNILTYSTCQRPSRCSSTLLKTKGHVVLVLKMLNVCREHREKQDGAGALALAVTLTHLSAILTTGQKKAPLSASFCYLNSALQQSLTFSAVSLPFFFFFSSIFLIRIIEKKCKVLIR